MKVRRTVVRTEKQDDQDSEFLGPESSRRITDKVFMWTSIILCVIIIIVAIILIFT